MIRNGRVQERGRRSASLLLPATMAFCVALSTVFLQLVQTRIYSVVYWNHLVYFIISIALLGFGISGTWLSFGESGRLTRVLTLRNAAVGFVVTTVLSSLLVPRTGVVLDAVLHSAPQVVRMLTTYAAAIFPYFFAGWILGTIYRDYAPHVHLLYFADLTGAASGCLLFLVLIQPCGAVNCVLLACVLVGGPILAVSARDKISAAVLVLTAAFLGISFWHEGALSRSIVPEPRKAYNLNFAEIARDDQKIVEFSEWNPISRIDVVSTRKKANQQRVYIDGDAWTGLMCNPGFPPLNASTDILVGHGTPYLFHQNPQDVLVIGVGGGVDVWMALRAGAERVDAVEINPTMARLLRNEYHEATYGLMDHPGVTSYVEDGRSFVRRSEKEYDVITMNAVDTLTALSSGAYVLSENYLYTVEAFMDYVSHLKPGGTLCITRWDYRAEAPRLFSVAVEALYQLGVSDPDKCMVSYSAQLNTLLVRNTPFSDTEIAAIKQQLAKFAVAKQASGISPGRFLFPLEKDAREDPDQRLFHRIAAMRADGTQRDLYQEYPLNIRPVWDDSPFFFLYDKPRDLFTVFRERGVGDVIRGHWASFTLFVLLAFTGAAVALFMGLPLVRRGRSKVPHFGQWLAYFSCLGVSFIFVEIALMQRFALLLGHPSRSIALVLGSLLFFAGAGSHLRKVLNIYLPWALGAVVTLILGAAFLYPAIAAAVLGWPLWARGLVTLALVAPLGFFMGMPFPTGIRLVSEHGKDAVPWMWGVNGGMTVLGSILAIILAIWLNFTAVLVTAAAGYLVALALFAAVLGRGMKTSGGSGTTASAR